MEIWNILMIKLVIYWASTKKNATWKVSCWFLRWNRTLEGLLTHQASSGGEVTNRIRGSSATSLRATDNFEQLKTWGLISTLIFEGNGFLLGDSWWSKVIQIICRIGEFDHVRSTLRWSTRRTSRTCTRHLGTERASSNFHAAGEYKLGWLAMPSWSKPMYIA